MPAPRRQLKTKTQRPTFFPAQVIRKEADSSSLPPLQEYVQAAQQRLAEKTTEPAWLL